MRHPAAPASPIVVKVGSSSLARPGGGVDDAALTRVVDQVCRLWDGGHPTILVTSGAVAAGIPALGLTERPTDMPSLQVAAAVGQGRLMERYTRAFDERGLVAGQVLLTKDILANRSQYLRSREAMARMLALGVVPIVNENDTVVVEELRLGDNDRLAAVVSHLVEAGMLVILTDTAGLYSGDPNVDSDVALLTAVRHTDQVLDEVAAAAGRGRFGSGGVATKVAAARMAAWSGIPTVIAPAADPNAAVRAVVGDDIGTWVAPQPSKLSARKLWIAFGQPSEGRIRIDDGAVRAVVERGGSLLAVGVTGVDGDFEEGAGVEVVDPIGSVVGKGVAGMAATELRVGLGKHTSEVGGEAVHRDDLVVFAT